MRLKDSDKITLWRLALGAISALNIALWVFSRFAATDAYGMRQWILCGIFTAVCAFRAILLRIDLERFVVVDHWLSSIFIGRTCATLAELSFAAQVALTLREVSAQTGLPGIGVYALFVVPVLATAQIFCWYSVATLNHGGHAVEESLWTLTHGLSGVCMALAWPHASAALKSFAAASAVLAAGFVAFMTSVDVPMYVRRWRAGRAGGASYLPVLAGLRDSWERRIPTKRWEDWKEEVAWLSMYFSFAVWVSLAMIHLPRK
jgi:hypothetical protein